MENAAGTWPKPKIVRSDSPVLLSDSDDSMCSEASDTPKRRGTILCVRAIAFKRIQGGKTFLKMQGGREGNYEMREGGSNRKI